MLHILQGPDRGKRFSLPAKEPQLIGRSSEALPISDRSVSRRHAELTPDNGRWFIRDLDSGNGTFVNGQRIEERLELRPGDQIRCGGTLMAFAMTPDEGKTSPIRILEPDVLETSVETRLESEPPSLIDGAEGPSVRAGADPLAAATQHLRIIYDLAALTASALDRDELLNRVMDLVFNQFQPDRGFILLQDRPEDRPMPAVVRYKTRPRNLEEGQIPVSRTIVQHTLRAGEGILSTNAMNDARFRSGDSVQAYGIRTAICVPIRTANRIFGVIHIDSSVAEFTYTESQLRLMNAIGQQTGLALMTVESVGDRLHTERLATMGQTVAWLSHSIKNILQGLRGGADAIELALTRGDLHMAREGWPILARNLDRIFSLTLNMLAYSKDRQLEIELTNLSKLLGEALDLVTIACERKHVGLITELDENMPPIPLDSSAMHQALMNLLTNAVEAAPEKKGLITIRTRYKAAEHEAEIIISDNGPGIAPEHHQHVFEPFTSTKGQRGTGLGLVVTRKIIAEHGGRIELRSDVNKGATFVITLPSDTATMDSSDTRLPRPAPTSEPEEDEFE